MSFSQLQLPPKARQEFSKGIRKLEQGGVEAACAHFEKAARRYPKFTGAWVAKGLCDLSRRRFEGAQEAFERAMEADPRSAHAAYGAAVAAFGSGRTELAVTLAERVAAWQPAGFAEHLHLLGAVRLIEGRRQDALVLLRSYLAHPAAKNRASAEKLLDYASSARDGVVAVPE
ncbi:MAG: tetratricopeptide repeat protein [Bryobacteraceae bacterium]